MVFKSTQQVPAPIVPRLPEQILFRRREGETRSLEIFRDPQGHVRGRVQDLHGMQEESVVGTPGCVELARVSAARYVLANAVVDLLPEGITVRPNFLGRIPPRTISLEDLVAIAPTDRPTPYEYALLSSAVDKSREAHEVAQGLRMRPVANPVVLPEGWKVLQISDNNWEGYFGAAYQNERTQHIVIAHRGFNHLGDLLGHQTSHQEEYAWRFTQRIGTDCPGYTFSCTGQSQGAWLAQVCVLYSKGVLSAVTLNDPGCKERLEEQKEKHGWCKNVCINDLDIVNYLFVQNPNYNHHVGTSYRLLSNPLVNIAPFNQLYSLVDYFDSETGMPRAGQYENDNPQELHQRHFPSCVQRFLTEKKIPSLAELPTHHSLSKEQNIAFLETLSQIYEVKRDGTIEMINDQMTATDFRRVLTFLLVGPSLSETKSSFETFVAKREDLFTCSHQTLLQNLESPIPHVKFFSELELSSRFERAKRDLKKNSIRVDYARNDLLELAYHAANGAHSYVFIRAMDLLIFFLEEGLCMPNDFHSLIEVYSALSQNMGEAVVSRTVRDSAMGMFVIERFTRALDLVLKPMNIWRVYGSTRYCEQEEEVAKLKQLTDEIEQNLSLESNWEVKHNLNSIAEGIKCLKMNRDALRTEYQNLKNLTGNWYLKTLWLWGSVRFVRKNISFTDCLGIIEASRDSTEWNWYYEKIALLTYILKHTPPENSAYEMAINALFSYYQPETWQTLSDEVKVKLLFVGEEFPQIGERQQWLMKIHDSSEYNRLERSGKITEQLLQLKENRNYWKVKNTARREFKRPAIREHLSPVSTFTGRKTLLKQIKHALRKPTENRPIAVVLSGLGGVGKTQLATKLIEHNAHLYDLIWTFNAESEETLQASYLAFAKRLNLVHEKDEVTAEEIHRRVNGYLRKPECCEWLLYFDNAGNPRELEKLFPSCNIRILITTRQSRSWETSVVIPVDEFEEEEAIEFLEKLIPQEKRDRDSVRELARELGYFPLALSQVSHCIQNDKHGLTTSTYLDDFLARRQELWTENHCLGEYSNAIETTWKMTMDRIRAEFPDAAEILNICAYFNADGIPLRWLKIWLNGKWHISSGFELMVKFSKVIGALRNFSLLREGVSLWTLRMHRFVQLVTQDAMTTEEKKEFLEKARQIVFEQFGKENTEEGLLHAISVTNHALALEEQGHLEADELQGIAALFHQIGQYWNGKGNASEAKRYLEEALRIQTAVCGQEVSTLIELGEVCCALNEKERAKDHLEKALAIDPDNDNALCHVGDVFYDLGEWQRAKTCFETALAQKQDDDSHPSVLQIQDKLKVVQGLLPVQLSLTAETKPTQDCGFPREDQCAPNTNSSQSEENTVDTFIQVLFRHFSRLFHPVGSWIDSIRVKVRNFLTIY